MNLLRQDRDEAAEPLARQAVAMNGHEMRTYGNLARAYYYSPSQRALAAEQFTTALLIGNSDLEVNPRDADVHTLSAYYCAMLGRRAEALRQPFHMV